MVPSWWLSSVNINDTFASGRCCVLQKLCWGGYTTLWLSYDSTLSRFTALKVVVADIGDTSNETRILRYLSSISAEHKGQRHLRKLVDYFTHDGSKGGNHSLVFGVDGVSIPTIFWMVGRRFETPWTSSLEAFKTSRACVGLSPHQ